MINAPAEFLDKNPWFKNGIQLEKIQAQLGKPLCTAPLVHKTAT